MPKAIWNGKVLAESERVERVEGNVYFPPGSVSEDLLRPSETTTVCGWKGEASYYHVVVDGETNRDAAWTYRAPKEAASRIRDFIAFWRGVRVEE